MKAQSLLMWLWLSQLLLYSTGMDWFRIQEESKHSFAFKNAYKVKIDNFCNFS